VAKFTESEILMGRSLKPDLSPELQSNLATLTGRLNAFFASYGPIRVSSGYRPSSANASAGGSTQSWHLKCAAADLSDADGAVWAFVCANLPESAKIGIWFEDKRWTPTWVHCQIYPPASGKRIYVPSAKPPLKPDAWMGVYDARLDSKILKP
jgi:hypothetical protein